MLHDTRCVSVGRVAAIVDETEYTKTGKQETEWQGWRPRDRQRQASPITRVVMHGIEVQEGSTFQEVDTRKGGMPTSPKYERKHAVVKPLLTPKRRESKPVIDWFTQWTGD